MTRHVIFVAPFIMDATLRFIDGASHMSEVNLSVISQEPSNRIPVETRARLAGHWQVSDALDPQQIVAAARQLENNLGRASSIFGPLEQLQVPLAIAREHLKLDGLGVEASLNFRDKSRMKTVLSQAQVPCARHALIGDLASAESFVQKVGFPLVVKPVAGAGGKSTFRF